jgi:alginate O-acetyltransferase complex protein AlgI
MSFTTPTFFVFLVIVYSLYWQFGRKGQNRVILAASLVFYGWWDWRFLFLLLFISSVDFWVADRLERTPPDDLKRRHWLLGTSLVANLGTLTLFKYFNFFMLSTARLAEVLGFRVDAGTLNVILPIGISFYTFQALSYTIDVYRGRLKAVDSFIDYFCFISFFPHMVAGPIQTARHLLVQFESERKFDWTTSVDGVRQMLWGFFKKMVVADSLAPLVNAAYGNPAGTSGWGLLWATYYFAFQIYCDFSGYTDIAIGCARLFGLNMTRNFAYPYFATNIKDFWRRWHISLSSWFRDYVYVSLGGNRKGAARASGNAFAVFVLSGLWHGANWTFVAWGALHGLYYHLQSLLTGAKSVEHKQPAWRAVLAMLGTFHLVLFAWVFFRAQNLSDAFTIIEKIGTVGKQLSAFERPSIVSGFLIAVVLGLEWIQRDRLHGFDLGWLPPVWRYATYYSAIGAIMMQAKLQYTPFIYFQF